MLTTTLRNDRYAILARGILAPEKVSLRLDSSFDLAPQGELEGRIEDLCQKLRDEGRRVLRLPVYRVGHWHCANTDLTLSAGITDYGVALAQRMHPEWFHQVLPTLAVSGLTIAQEHVLVERRSAQVAMTAGMYHVKPSGGAQPPEDLRTALYRETFEELGLRSDMLSDCQVLAVIQTGPLLDVVYRTMCNQPLKHLLQGNGADAWEHEQLLGLDCRAQPLARWCRERFLETSPPGHAALMLEGWLRYGDGWFDPLWRELTPAGDYRAALPVSLEQGENQDTRHGHNHPRGERPTGQPPVGGETAR